MDTIIILYLPRGRGLWQDAEPAFERMLKRMKTAMRRKKQKGFTLIELIIIIAVLAILAAVAIPAYQNVSQGAEKNIAKTEAGTLATSLNTYNTIARTSEQIGTVTGVTAKMSSGTVVLITGDYNFSVSFDSAANASRAIGNIEFKNGAWFPKADITT